MKPGRRDFLCGVDAVWIAGVFWNLAPHLRCGEDPWEVEWVQAEQEARDT